MEGADIGCQSKLSVEARRQYRDSQSRSLGYAIVCYRDAAEASLALRTLDGLQVTPSSVLGEAEAGASFVLRARRAERGDVEPGVEGESVKQLDDLEGRCVRRFRGRPLPADLVACLRQELETLRWPARNQRPSLCSEQYLVLHSASPEGYRDLRLLCAELMAWADPQFYYSGIAVTKNFVASPHTDEQDKTHQYAVSLGDFSGGELCVEEDSSVAVLDTRNRIARIDGRRMHWVRSFTGSDRFSLIFYDTSNRREGVASKVQVS